MFSVLRSRGAPDGVHILRIRLPDEGRVEAGTVTDVLETSRTTLYGYSGNEAKTGASSVSSSLRPEELKLSVLWLMTLFMIRVSCVSNP